MLILNHEQVGQRSLEMFAAIEKITDEEIKENATEYAQQRIEDMRECAELVEDDSFFSTLIEMAEEYASAWFDELIPEDFTNKINLLKKMVE